MSFWVDVDGYDMPPKYGSSKQFGNDIRSEVKWSGVEWSIKGVCKNKYYEFPNITWTYFWIALLHESDISQLNLKPSTKWSNSYLVHSWELLKSLSYNDFYELCNKAEIKQKTLEAKIDNVRVRLKESTCKKSWYPKYSTWLTDFRSGEWLMVYYSNVCGSMAYYRCMIKRPVLTGNGSGWWCYYKGTSWSNLY